MSTKIIVIRGVNSSYVNMFFDMIPGHSGIVSTPNKQKCRAKYCSIGVVVGDTTAHTSVIFSVSETETPDAILYVTNRDSDSDSPIPPPSVAHVTVRAYTEKSDDGYRKVFPDAIAKLRILLRYLQRENSLLIAKTAKCEWIHIIGREGAKNEGLTQEDIDNFCIEGRLRRLDLQNS